MKYCTEVWARIRTNPKMNGTRFQYKAFNKTICYTMPVEVIVLKLAELLLLWLLFLPKPWSWTCRLLVVVGREILGASGFGPVVVVDDGTILLYPSSFWTNKLRGIPAFNDQIGGYQWWKAIVDVTNPNTNPAITSDGWCQWSTRRDAATNKVHPNGKHVTIKENILDNRVVLWVVLLFTQLVPCKYKIRNVIPQAIKLECPDGKEKFAYQ